MAKKAKESVNGKPLTRKRQKGEKPERIEPLKRKCDVCGAEYTATKQFYANGDIVITPPRCENCQTVHITNLRVNKAIKDFQLLGNLKARLSDVQRQAVIDVLSAEFNSLLDRYSGSTVKASAFDLKKVKA